MPPSTEGVSITLLDVFDVAIGMERSAEQFYAAAAGRMDDPGLRLLLRGLASTEHDHGEAWRREKEALVQDAAQTPGSDDGVVGAYLATWAVAGPHASTEEELSRLVAAADPLGILATAVRMERDAIAFYSGLADFVADDAARQRVRRVIADERRHATDLVAAMRRFCPEPR